jgi:hypothetical protein
LYWVRSSEISRETAPLKSCGSLVCGRVNR